MRLVRAERLEDEDDIVLAQAARDAHEAFVALYERYVERVGSYVYARLGSTADVDDLVSMTFMRVLTRLDTFRPDRGSFAVWLFAIARNVVHDHHRAARKVVPIRALDAAPATQ